MIHIGDNARIGLVSFNSEKWLVPVEEHSGIWDVGGLIEKSNRNFIDEGINILEADEETGTCTWRGIDLAKENLHKFGRADAKKVMIVLTDGAPSTPHQNTIQSYINAEQSGIRILTILYNIPNVELKRKMIEQKIGAGEICYANGGGIVDVLGIEAVKFVEGYEIGTKQTPKKVIKSKIETVTKEIQNVAQDDIGRREQTINNVNEVDYTKGKILKKLDVPYDSSVDYTDVSDMTYMTASGKVVVDNVNDNDSLEYKMDLVLTKRKELEPEVSKEVETIKITLSDGNVLIYKDVHGPINNIGSIIENTNQYLAVMDDELIHGAELEIKYKIIIKDNDSIFNGKYTVYDYIDKEVKIKESPGWSQITEDDRNYLISNMVNEYGVTEEQVKTHISDKVIIKKDFTSSETESELIVTRLLAKNSSDEYENYIEIAKYSNVLGIRRRYSVPANINLMRIYDEDEANNIEKYELENDSAKAKLVNIIPPFGGEKNTIFTNMSIYIAQKSSFFKK